MKKLVKKQMGGPKKPVSGQVPTIKTEKKGSQAEMMKPNPKQPKFDASKVSTKGAILKGAERVGSKDYKADTTIYKKKMGGSIKKK